MTGHNRVVIGGIPVHERLEAARGRLVPAMLVRLVDDLPMYGRLPEELIDNDLRRTCDQAIQLFITFLRTGSIPEGEALATLRVAAANRADEGVGLENVLSAYYIGTRVCLDHLGADAADQDLSAFLDMAGILLRFLQVVTAAAADAFTEERNTMLKDDLASGQALTSALLEGTADENVAARAGIRLPVTYVAMTLVVGPHDDEGRSDLEPRVVVRRKLRRLRDELSRHVKDPVLWIPSDDGGLAVVPSATEAGTFEDWGWVKMLVAASERCAQADVTATAAAAPWNQVDEAARLSRELMQVVASAGRPPGLYQLADLALEYQLSRPGPAQRQLAGLLAPLRGKPELLTTLQAFVDTDLNRRRTATRLRVHPNTIDNRLRKIADLTGLDPTRPADVQRIGVALAALSVTGS